MLIDTMILHETPDLLMQSILALETSRLPKIMCLFFYNYTYCFTDCIADPARFLNIQKLERSVVQ